MTSRGNAGASSKLDRMDLRRSTVTTGDDGWTWLAADRRGARLRQTAWSLVLSLLLIGLAAAATLPPRALAIPLVAIVLGASLWLVGRLWRRSHSAVAVSARGVAVRTGFDVAQIGWPAVVAVIGAPAGGRVRIVVETRDGQHASAATFTRGPASDWLATATATAASRHLAPQPLDGIAGFRAAPPG